MEKMKSGRGYHKLYFIFIVMGLLLFVSIGVSWAADAEYMSLKKCKICHKEQYASWEGTAHAKAFSVLKADEQKNAECVQCHTTGYGLPAASGADLENVQCEACHGPGSLYSSPKIMSKSKFKKDPEGSKAAAIEAGLIIPTEEVCVKCHNEKSPNFKPFHFEEMVEKIKHK